MQGSNTKLFIIEKYEILKMPSILKYQKQQFLAVIDRKISEYEKLNSCKKSIFAIITFQYEIDKNKYFLIYFNSMTAQKTNWIFGCSRRIHQRWNEKFA